jgi:4-hydroxy-tetrahydrodipicolinate reductase
MASGAIKVCVVGAAGRMGRLLTALIREEERLDLAAALDGAAGSLADGTQLTADPVDAVGRSDVVVDFSAPAAATRLAPLCAEHGAAYVVGSTGLERADTMALDAAAAKVPVLQAANFSIGVNVLLELVETAARRLGDSFEVEISEIHHKHKRDAPSGTALALRDAVVRGRGEVETVLGRSGASGERARDELGIAALRGGDVSGEHTVYYFGSAERIELTHRATSREIFARGALRAALWIAGRPAGRYEMRDVVRAE